MKFIFACIIALSPVLAGAQCCPYVNSVVVLPTNPTATDNVKIITTVTTPNQGLFLSSSSNVSGNTIEIEACYYNGLLTATQTFIDTLDIGTLPEGTYTIDFTAYQSTDTSTCNYTDSMSSTSTFTVHDETAGLPSISNDFSRIYPTPSNGSFKVDLSDVTINSVIIRSVSGAIVYRGKIENEFTLNIDSGTYIIEFLEDEATKGYNRLVIQ